MQLIINTTNTKLSVKNKLFFIENNIVQKHINPKKVSGIAITVNCTLNASIIKLAAQNQIPIYFYNNFGTIQAKMYSPYFKNLANLRRKQLLFYTTNSATNWIISTLLKKGNRQINNLNKFNKNNNSSIINNINKIQKLLKKLRPYSQQSIDECRNNLMGIEGNISKYYFQSLALLLPKEYNFKTRNRKPALDYFNAALNYLYGMTYSVVESGVFAKGLDPFNGYLHTENYQKTALVFDLIEPIRPIIDEILITLCLNKELKDKHFIKKEQGFWLSKEGKKLIIPTFNEYLYKRIKLDNKIRRIKDIIYQESFDLGLLIENYYKK